MSQHQEPEDNPYLATPVTDIAGAPDRLRSPGPIVTLFATLLGVATAILSFVFTLLLTCTGVLDVGGLTEDTVIPISFLVGTVTAIAMSWFTVSGFLKIVKAFRS